MANAQRFTARDHGQECNSSAPAPFAARASGMNLSNNPLQADQAWIVQDPRAPVTVETANATNHRSAGASSIDAAVDLTDDAAQDGSYGTLMLSEGGRSKYLGPTAGSEWLRDVCKMSADI